MKRLKQRNGMCPYLKMAVAGGIILGIFAGGLPAMAGEVPALINYQARLTNKATGVPVNDSVHDLKFTVMGSVGGVDVIGGPYTYMDVTINNGLVNLQVALTASDFSAIGARYLKVEVGNGDGTEPALDSVFEELTPRQQLVSVPYAFEATSAATATALAGGEVDSVVAAINGIVKSNGTTISAAVAGTDYLASESDPNALLTAGIDNVKNTHIDWGTGQGQVSQDDVVDGILYMKTENNFTDTYMSYLNQEVTTNATPTFTGLTLTALEVNGVITATGGTSTDWNNAATLGACDGINTVYDVDGNRYGTVVIGGQCWMSENMRTTQYPDKTAITKGCIAEDCGDWDTDTTQYSCPPNVGNTAEDCNAAYRYGENSGTGTGEALGMFYQWSAAMNGSTDELAQGICPEGWHIPTNGEWEILEEYLGSADCRTDVGWQCTPAGNKMKTPDNCSVAGDSNCSISGFNGLLTGARGTNSNYYTRGSNTYLWSSTVGTTGAWKRCLYSTESNVYRNDYDKANGFSVRCLKD